MVRDRLRKNDGSWMNIAVECSKRLRSNSSPYGARDRYQRNPDLQLVPRLAASRSATSRCSGVQARFPEWRSAATAYDAICVDGVVSLAGHISIQSSEHGLSRVRLVEFWYLHMKFLLNLLIPQS